MRTVEEVEIEILKKKFEISILDRELRQRQREDDAAKRQFFNECKYY